MLSDKINKWLPFGLTYILKMIILNTFRYKSTFFQLISRFPRSIRTIFNFELRFKTFILTKVVSLPKTKFMILAIKILIGVIALFHCYILWFEMFAWETRGRKVFRSFPKELFSQTKVMAANQGLYNGFLAAGLFWSFFIQSQVWQNNVAIFFLSCIAIAGLYGAMTASKKILFVQTVPSVITIGLILLSQS